MNTELFLYAEAWGVLGFSLIANAFLFFALIFLKTETGKYNGGIADTPKRLFTLVDFRVELALWLLLAYVVWSGLGLWVFGFEFTFVVLYATLLNVFITFLCFPSSRIVRVHRSFSTSRGLFPTFGWPNVEFAPKYLGFYFQLLWLLGLFSFVMTIGLL